MSAPYSGLDHPDGDHAGDHEYRHRIRGTRRQARQSAYAVATGASRTDPGSQSDKQSTRNDERITGFQHKTGRLSLCKADQDRSENESGQESKPPGSAVRISEQGTLKNPADAKGASMQDH